MNEKTIKRIRLAYGIVLSVVTVAAGICLMAACLGIYRSGGEQTYTPDKVAAAFGPIAWVVYLCLALVIGGFILDFALPVPSKKVRAEKNRALILQRLRNKADLSDPELLTQVRAQQNSRKLHTAASLALLAAGAVVFLAYALDGSHFDSVDITGSVVSAMWWLIPCAAVPFGYGIFAAYHARSSMDREIALMKQVGTAENRPAPESRPAPNWDIGIRCAVLGLAVIFIVCGFLAGGWADVLTKAVNICTECVGLG